MLNKKRAPLRKLVGVTTGKKEVEWGEPGLNTEISLTWKQINTEINFVGRVKFPATFSKTQYFSASVKLASDC